MLIIRSLLAFFSAFFSPVLFFLAILYFTSVYGLFKEEKWAYLAASIGAIIDIVLLATSGDLFMLWPLIYDGVIIALSFFLFQKARLATSTPK